MRAVALLFLSASLLAAEFAGKVVVISDGDTIKVMHNGRAERIRLYGIDCPENAQPWGHRARNFTGELAFGQVVTVKVRDTDRYGRTVGDVILRDGSSLNRELVHAGLAWWYLVYARNDLTLGRLEDEARRAKCGLWSDPKPVPPWEWRWERRAGRLRIAPENL